MKTTKTKQFLVSALLGCMVAPVAAQTVDVTLQCGQSYTINSTVAAGTATPTYRWLENGSTVAGAAANYTVPATKSVGIYTYIRQAKSAGCADWQNSNAFTVEVQNKNDDGVCINGLMWATRNVDLPGTFAATIYDPGKLYQFNRTTALDPASSYLYLPTISESGDWSPDSIVCPTNWRLPNSVEYNNLVTYTPKCGTDYRGLITPVAGTLPGNNAIVWAGPHACEGELQRNALPLLISPLWASSGAPWPDRCYLWTSTLATANIARGAPIFGAPDDAGSTGITYASPWPVYRALNIRCVQ
jgi:hypothetical protein